jgi:hypothetical protein
MITAKVSISNQGALSNVTKMLEQTEAVSRAHQMRLAIAMQMYVKMALKELLQDKAEHFEVRIEQSGVTMTIIVNPKNDSGKRIMTGRRAGPITSATPMPIGNGLFAQRVYHPGVQGKSDKIMQAIDGAIAKAVTAVRGFDARGGI